MRTQAIDRMREDVKKYIDLADQKTVKMIYSLLEADHKDDLWADADFVAEMDRRVAEYNNGTAKLLTLDELESKARLAFELRMRLYTIPYFLMLV